MLINIKKGGGAQSPLGLFFGQSPQQLVFVSFLCSCKEMKSHAA